MGLFLFSDMLRRRWLLEAGLRGSMSIDLRGLRVFVASPGGLEDERDRFREVLREYSEQDAHDRGVAFIPVGWENTRAGVGRPQSLINAQIESCDFLLLILHERWGSPPGDSPIGADFTSGTEEEFALAMKLVKEAGKAMVDVAVLFKHVDPSRLADPGAQLQKVIDFKKKLERERAVLYWTFGLVDEFEKRLRQLLLEWIRLPAKSATPIAFASAARASEVKAGEGLTHLVPELAGAQIAPDQTEHRSKLVTQAIAFANGGQLVDAETAFARAVLDPLDYEAQFEFGKFLERLGRLDEAQAAFQSLAVTAQRGNTLLWESRALRRLGLISLVRSDFALAMRNTEAAQSLAGKANSESDAAACLGNLGLIEQTRGNLDAAEAYHKKSLAISEKLGGLEGMAIQYGNLGLIEQARRNLDAAEAYHKKSLAISEKLGGIEVTAIQYGNLGLIERARGNLKRAEAYHKKALAIEEKRGRLEGMANQYGGLGLIEQARGDLNTAKAYHMKAMAIEEKLGRQEGIASDCGNLGLIERAQGNLDEAQRLWVRARDLFRKIGVKDREMLVQGWLDGLK